MNPIKQQNKPQSKQTATADKYPQGYFHDKPCRECSVTFKPKAPSHLYCSDECCDIATQRAFLKRVYNITLEEYQHMYKRQSGLCAICKTEGFTLNKNQRQKIVIDHCHETGRIRGLLCHNCNRALGLLKDSEENLKRAIEYLKVGD